MSKLKIKKVEGIPRRFKAVKVTKDNIGQIATWIESPHYKINYDSLKRPVSVTYYFQGDINNGPVLVLVGGYILKVVGTLPPYIKTRFYGLRAVDFENDHRKGWS